MSHLSLAIGAVIAILMMYQTESVTNFRWALRSIYRLYVNVKKRGACDDIIDVTKSFLLHISCLGS